MSLQPGDAVPRETDIVRRLNPDWIEGDTVAPEAFRPRHIDMKSGVSCEVEYLMPQPVYDNLYWKGKGWMAGKLKAATPIDISYPVIFTGGVGGAHAEIRGDLQKLVSDEGLDDLYIMASATTVIPKPANEQQTNVV